MTMFAVEVRYTHGQTGWRTIAKFNILAAAEEYAARHQGEGGGKLRVTPTDDNTYLPFHVSDDVSFAYYVEAKAYEEYMQRGCGGIP